MDEVVGRVRASLERAGVWDRSAVAILSDHEFRRRTPAAEHAHVPLLVKAPGQRGRVDVWDEAQAQAVVGELVRRFART